MFTVVYKWKIKKELEKQFIENWKKVTEIFYNKHKSLGSRLHKTEDDFFIAYAQWPDKYHWEKENVFTEEEKVFLSKMRESIEESFDPILCNVVEDLLKNSQA